MRRAHLILRIRLVSAGVLLLALVLLARLYQIQIVQSAEYHARAERQYVHTKSDLFSRGSIYFKTRDGEHLSAAAVQSGFVLAANPTHVNDKEAFCTALADYIQNTHEWCVVKMSQEDRTYVELEQRVSKETAATLEELVPTGVLLYKNQWRYYPGGSVAARTVGFVGYSSDDGNELRGKYGLERQYDDVLYRSPEVLSVNFFAELFSNVGELVTGKNTARSGDIVTTLEPSVSRMLDTVLIDTNDLYHSALTGAVIMNPKTGAIYAMNAVPGFDLNDRAEATIEQFRNPLVEDVYEFGSTIKALTMAAGLDAGAIAPYTTYYDPGEIELDTFTIRNFDGRGRGTVPMQEILNQSLNTGASWIVTQMGKQKFREYFLNFKLGSETGIDLPNEAYGLVDNLQSPRDVEYATASFGQGIALTPIAATRAFAALGNGGHLVTPHVASGIEYSDGTSKEIRYPEGTQVLKPETSEEISRMLSVVVDEALRGGKVALPHHTIAAKTGTAQIPDPVNGGYYEDKFLHSFFGYFPAYDPEIIVFMYTVEPQGVQYASETLTDPFMQIAKFLINYYSIPPDR
ncbi:MAG: penicillin-binding protein 2 [Patescibacteria group bacterium]